MIELEKKKKIEKKKMKERRMWIEDFYYKNKKRERERKCLQIFEIYCLVNHARQHFFFSFL